MPAVVKAFIERHIQHLNYPSSKSEIVAACARMAEMPKSDREWIEQNLPDGNYKSADEVIRALKLQSPHSLDGTSDLDNLLSKSQ